VLHDPVVSSITQDIHGWVEVALGSDVWAAVISIDVLVERNQSLWGWLFQQDGAFPPVAPGRGLPSDVSARIAQEVDILQAVADERQMHSFTWAYWREIEAVDWDAPPLAGARTTANVLIGQTPGPEAVQPQIVRREFKTRRDTLEYAPGWRLLFDLMRRMGEQYGGERVRLIVWFEN
jgi:hypothetical protein